VLSVVSATRYVTPLREGGSLPGLVEADDLGTYVVKFAGAGQGPLVLVAEIIVGELARRLGLPVPVIKLLELDARIGRYEPDEEVQDLLTASVGLNLAVDFLPGSLGVEALPPRLRPVDAALAARVLWLDALVANVDRSWRNPNLLVWHGNLWCIDHGASLRFQHGWAAGRYRPSASAAAFAAQPYDAADHVLAPHLTAAADALADADRALAAQVSEPLLREVVGLVPDVWLAPAPGLENAASLRDAYVEHLLARVGASRADRTAWLPRAGEAAA
jgi:hypothetical protein